MLIFVAIFIRWLAMIWQTGGWKPQNLSWMNIERIGIFNKVIILPGTHELLSDQSNGRRTTLPCWLPYGVVHFELTPTSFVTCYLRIWSTLLCRKNDERRASAALELGNIIRLPQWETSFPLNETTTLADSAIWFIRVIINVEMQVVAISSCMLHLCLKDQYCYYQHSTQTMLVMT